MVRFQCSFYLCDLFLEVTYGILEVLSLCSKSGVGLTTSCKSDSGFVELLPAGICTGWTRRRGLTGVLLFCGGGGTQMSECFWWVVPVGSKQLVGLLSFFFFLEVVRQIYLGQ